MEIRIYHDNKTLKSLRLENNKRKKSFSKVQKYFLKHLDVRRFCKFSIYGKVISITTKNIKTSLFILENIIPMTFFTLSILGTFIYKKLGFRELLRIPLNDYQRKF